MARQFYNIAMNVLTGLENQPDFPKQDLTESNAQLLELMLANFEIVETGHRQAELISWVYRVGHRSEVMASQRIMHSEAQLESFDHGVRTFEAASSLVRSTAGEFDELIVNHNGVALVHAMSDDQLRDYISEAREKFGLEMPKTVEVVTETSKRLNASLAGYAIFGAALARQFELDAVA
ncbi:MAG TPA: hypothetical protein VFK03_01140 [Candidatus Saccharimonadales bacterium]|nr:hypothetical protein [Candidatus Saccharimonadales bacterium]